MKSAKTQLAETIRLYFTKPRNKGLCSFTIDTSRPIYNLFVEYSQKWQYSIKHWHGGLVDFFIPKSTDPLYRNDVSSKIHYFDTAYKNKDPMRRELANFILREIARETKTKFIPVG